MDSLPVGLEENRGDRVCENATVHTNRHLPAGRRLLFHSLTCTRFFVYSSGKRQPRGGVFGAALRQIDLRQIVLEMTEERAPGYR